MTYTEIETDSLTHFQAASLFPEIVFKDDNYTVEHNYDPGDIPSPFNPMTYNPAIGRKKT